MLTLQEREVEIPFEEALLKGNLSLPEEYVGVVVFVHGTGSSRFSPRNIQVAEELHEHKMGTLLFDLLTEEEDDTYVNRFDIELLSDRLAVATEWLKQEVGASPISFFGASTGAAAAFKVAAYWPEIKAIVSRGGRPDLSMSYLHKVRAPTLFIVGSLDTTVWDLNQTAFEVLDVEKKFVIIPGASHLFEEKGAMDTVVENSMQWFLRHFGN